MTACSDPRWLASPVRVNPESLSQRRYRSQFDHVEARGAASLKIGIIGTGNVGCACAMAAAVRRSAREIVLVNRTRKTAEAVAADIQYGALLGRKVDIVAGDYDALKGAGIVLITSGMNEKAGVQPTVTIRKGG